MKIEYYCDNYKCQKVLKKSYDYRLKIEKVMDEKNIAQMFCPHCGSELQTKKSKP